MKQRTENFPLTGNGKEIRSWIKEFMINSQLGIYSKLNDYIMGIDKNDEPLWVIDYGKTHEENLEELKNIDLRSKELVEVNIFQECGERGIETIYKD